MPQNRQAIRLATHHQSLYYGHMCTRHQLKTILQRLYGYLSNLLRTNSKIEKTEHGWISPILISVSHYWYWKLSLSMLVKNVHSQSRKYKIVDLLIILSFGIVIISFYWLTSNWGSATNVYKDVFNVVLLTILIYRIIDILLVWFYVHLVARSKTVTILDEDKKSIATYGEPYAIRTLLLVFINFFEVITIFAVFAFITNPFIDTRWQSFFYSIGTITTIGVSKEPAHFSSQLLFAVELIYGLFFILIVIQRTLDLFKRDNDSSIKH